MHKNLLAAGFAALLMTSAVSAQTLNVATAGDQNMVDYIKEPVTIAITGQLPEHNAVEFLIDYILGL